MGSWYSAGLAATDSHHARLHAGLRRADPGAPARVHGLQRPGGPHHRPRGALFRHGASHLQERELLLQLLQGQPKTVCILALDRFPKMWDSRNQLGIN